MWSVWLSSSPTSLPKPSFWNGNVSFSAAAWIEDVSRMKLLAKSELHFPTTKYWSDLLNLKLWPNGFLGTQLILFPG